MATIVLFLIAIVPTETEASVDFENDIIPLLTKASCNSGACHGAAIGRGGFKLSLYGGDPRADYQAIVLELEGRRVNPARPQDSLIVLKPTESIEHGGGYRFDFGDPSADLLLSWIEQGSPREPQRQLAGVEISPKSQFLDQPGDSFKLQATASYRDGTTRDVTPWTVFTPEDASAVEIDNSSAQATILRRGRHIIVARYLDQVVSLEAIVPLSDAPIDLTQEVRNNFIDRHILDLLSTLRLPPSGLADDATYLRRVTLDLTGRLPTPESVSKFLSDDDADKRTALVEGLLQSEQFTEVWTYRLAKLLRIHTQPQDNEGARVYHAWLREQIAANTPYDRLVRDLIQAEGDSHVEGPANFYRTVAGPREQAEFMSELFMGSRLRCANCHNHPLDRWTQDDYHGLAAIFAKVQSARVVTVNPRGVVTHPRTGEDAVARIPGEQQYLENAIEGRRQLAEWLTARDNPFFAKAFVNRLWKAMLGRGLVEPADDLRATNPATHPALLDQLAEDFSRHGYSLRHTLRTIALSSTYARSANALAGNAADQQFYSHALRRPLEAEVLADAISDVTGISEAYGDQPLGTRAISLFDPAINSDALDILGRCSREESCETTGEPAGGLATKLHMFNGDLLNRRLADPHSRLSLLLQESASVEQIVKEFYLRGLGRFPSLEEQEYWRRQLDDDVVDHEREQSLQDFVWSLLTCSEFVTNH